MKISDLLEMNSSEFEAPVQFPAGTYVMVITGYDMLPFFWKNKGIHGLAYVPSVKPVSCIEADDDSNPELQKEQLKALEDFGDWTNKEFKFAYTPKDSKTLSAAVSPINFPLFECDEDGTPKGKMEKHAWRFHLVEKDGTEQGFIHDILGLSYPNGEKVGTIMEDTVGKTFIATIGYEVNKADPTRQNLVFQSITSA